MIRLWDVSVIDGDWVGTFAACSADDAVVVARHSAPWGEALRSVAVLDYEVAELRSQAWECGDNYLAECCHNYLFGVATGDEVENIAIALTDAS